MLFTSQASGAISSLRPRPRCSRRAGETTAIKLDPVLATMYNLSNSLFLRVPKSLRTRIFALVSDPIEIRAQHVKRRLWLHKVSPIIALRATCSQLHQETALFAERHNVLRLDQFFQPSHLEDLLGRKQCSRFRVLELSSGLCDLMHHREGKWRRMAATFPRVARIIVFWESGSGTERARTRVILENMFAGGKRPELTVVFKGDM